MGTLVLSNITTRKQMIDYLTSRETADGYELLDHSAKGNVLYTVYRHPDGYRFISVFKLTGPTAYDRSQGDYGWGYKEICESMGPSFYGCPERLLRQSDVEDTYGWREECRAQRRRQKALKVLAATLKPGTTLKMFKCWDYDPETRKQTEVLEDVVFDYNWSATFFVGHRPGGKQYRFYWRNVRHAETELAAA